GLYLRSAPTGRPGRPVLLATVARRGRRRPLDGAAQSSAPVPAGGGSRRVCRDPGGHSPPRRRLGRSRPARRGSSLLDQAVGKRSEGGALAFEAAGGSLLAGRPPRPLVYRRTVG